MTCTFRDYKLFSRGKMGQCRNLEIANFFFFLQANKLLSRAILVLQQI